MVIVTPAPRHLHPNRRPLTREQAEWFRAARICREAGATAAQAREAARGNPELTGLAEAMEACERGAAR